MFAHVKLLNGFQTILTYKVPYALEPNLLPNTIVTVPLQRRTEKAIVIELIEKLPPDCTFKIREILYQDPFPYDLHFSAFIETVGSFYATEPLSLLQRLTSFLKKSASDSLPQNSIQKLDVQEENANKKTKQLTSEQESCVNQLLPFVKNGGFHPTVLQGVTGSGKTEVYLALIAEALSLNKSVIFLLPEVSLAVRFTRLFSEQLSNQYPIFGFHSASSKDEKRNLWSTLIEGKPTVIVGVHLPSLLPVTNLGLIIVDEEHDVGYQEKKHPKMNSKEIALIRAQKVGIPIILGSATPSIQSLYNVAQKKWSILRITKRFAGEFPSICVVNLKNEKKRPQFWISKQLENAINDRLLKKEQTIIFLNRRGYSFFVQCSSCGFIFNCPSCSVSLTLHQDKTIRCHYCTHQENEPDHCPSCGPKAKLLKKGIGTEQAVVILQKLFPQAHIARADMDSTINKKKWEKTVQEMIKGEIDILVGTQTITKGYHFPGVTLVGVLWADMHLSLPFFNAAETTLQQLIQVAGRAGRQNNESLVIIQSLTDHPIFKHLDERLYESFYNEEIVFRKLLNYPPIMRLGEIEMRNNDDTTLENDAQIVSQILSELKTSTFPELIILGPAQPPVHKIKNIFIRKFYLKAPSFTLLSRALHATLETYNGHSELLFTPHPLR